MFLHTFFILDASHILERPCSSTVACDAKWEQEDCRD